MSANTRLDWAQRFALLKTAMFFVLVPGTVAGYIPYRLLERPTFPPVDTFVASQWIAAGIALLGLAGLLWCGWDFATKGRGTPAPLDPPKSLVVTGPYRWVRNPMYVFVLTVLLGESLFFRSDVLLKYAALFLILAHLFVWLYEEPHLRGQFGAAYENYCNRVRRWIPRPPRS